MARGSAPKRATRSGGHEAWMDDEVDEHHRGRDKISLDPDAPSSDDDDLDDEEAVMDIDADAESEDSEDSDESDSETSEGEGAKGGKAKPRADRSEGGAESASDEDEAALYKAMKAQQKKLNSRAPTRARRDDSDTDDASDSDSEDRGAGVRGARKADFYGDDEVDHEGASDEDERVEEEREALRLQRVAADEMDAADFGLEDESDDDDEEDDRATPLGAKAKALAGGAGKKPSAKKEKKEKKEKREKKALGAAVESLGADPSLAGSLASDVVASDAPELIALTKELTRNLDEVRCSVEPVIAAARAGDLATAEGVSYLDAKHLLMLSYCVNIVFYLLLKAEGRPVRDHPVVLRLVEIRTYLEKLRPVDRKLRYQIDKLVKMADRPSEERAAEEEDPLAFRPNPDALVSKVDEDAEEGGAGGAYRPPKMLPTAMEGEFEEGGKSNKEKRKEKEARKRANRSALIKELAQELGEAPEELGGDDGGTSSAFAKRELARMEARAKIEEDLFTRVPLSKTERRRQKATSRSANNALAHVGDFGDDVADLVEAAEAMDDAAPSRGRARLADAVASAGVAKVTKAPKPVGGEEDVPLRDSLGDRRNKYERGVNRKQAQRAAAAASGMYDADDSREFVSEDPAYEAAETARDARRAAKEAKYARRPGVVAAMEEEMDGEDAKRDVGKKIMANRGLTPHRNKDHKNPRKRLRGKFEKAVVRRKGQVRSMREDAGGYGGEASGIKTSVTKSRRF